MLREKEKKFSSLPSFTNMLHIVSILMLLSSIVILQNLNCISVEKREFIFLFNSKEDSSSLGIPEVVLLV